MKNQSNVQTDERGKRLSILFLFITSIIIILVGIAFGIYSIVNNTIFSVLNSNIHGAVFAGVIIFLGVRYFLSVRKLKIQVYKSTSKFSWSNFKKQKKHVTVK